MPSADLSTQAIGDLVGSRHTVTGTEFPPAGLQPYHDWLIRTLHRLAEGSAGALRVERSDQSPMSVCVAPGRASIAGVALSLDESTLDLSGFNNDTALIWLADNAAAAELNAASHSTGWPGSAHLKLAEVTLSAGAISGVLDRRFETVFRV